MNDDAIRRIYARLREIHPELRTRPTWEGLRRILARENVTLVEAPLPRPASLLGFDGMWAIVVDKRRPARHLYYCMHELAHLWLHVDAAPGGRFDFVYNMDDFLGDDPREAEADYLVECIFDALPIEQRNE